MPLSVFKKLGLGEVKPSTICLQLADRFLTYPWGVIDDVLVKVDKFIFPVDFIVLDMEEDLDVPLILGRPFLAIGGALIGVQSGGLTLWVNGEEVTFSIYHSMKLKDEKATCYWLESNGDHVVKTQLGLNPKVPLEGCLTSPMVDESKLTNDGNMHNLYAQEARYKESTLFHVREEWVQEVKNPPKFGLFESLWYPREKEKGGTSCTFT